VITIRPRGRAWAHGRSGQRRSTHVILEVADTGTGMDEETRKRCLEPFFSTKGQMGTGLGLAMVYGVIQRHDGAIEVESETGKGTIMRLVFPVRQSARAELIEARPDEPTIEPLRILFVDDEPLLRELLKEILESEGHQVQVADGGGAALDAFRTASRQGKSFDVVITDLGMPHLDGRQLAEILKRESPSTPILMMTGWGSLMKSEGDLPEQVEGILNKPPKIGELQEALKQIVQQRSRTGQA
jgi:CheY-like chemotaxis protein